MGVQMTVLLLALLAILTVITAGIIFAVIEGYENEDC